MLRPRLEHRQLSSGLSVFPNAFHERNHQQPSGQPPVLERSYSCRDTGSTVRPAGHRITAMADYFVYIDETGTRGECKKDCCQLST